MAMMPADRQKQVLVRKLDTPQAKYCGEPADKCATTMGQPLSGSLAGAVSDHACAIAAGSRHGLAGQRFETPEAAWDASWKEGQRLVKLYQAELQVGSATAQCVRRNSSASTCPGNAAA